jgi:hypothetical protein
MLFIKHLAQVERCVDSQGLRYTIFYLLCHVIPTTNKIFASAHVFSLHCGIDRLQLGK